jgi:excisionase family DNA binding protein
MPVSPVRDNPVLELNPPRPEHALTPLLLTSREAAELVRLCEKSLYLAVRAGELPVVRMGRAVRFRRRDLEQWVLSKVMQEAPRE